MTATHNKQEEDDPLIFGRTFLSALQETDKVATRLEEELDKVPGLETAFAMLSSFVWGCGAKLIERPRRQRDSRPLDVAVMRACSRLFSDCMGGYTLLRRGLVLPAIPVLRAALETTMQTIAFLERPTMAAEWLSGRQFKPSKARDTSPTAAALYQGMYKRLSDHAHLNVAAVLFHTAPLPDREGEALVYGGWYAPRSAGMTMCEFARVELAFLRAFYVACSSELEELGLLFQQRTTALMKELGYAPNDVPPNMWAGLLDAFESLIEAAEQHLLALEDDRAVLGAVAADRLARQPAGEPRIDPGEIAAAARRIRALTADLPRD